MRRIIPITTKDRLDFRTIGSTSPTDSLTGRPGCVIEMLPINQFRHTSRILPVLRIRTANPPTAALMFRCGRYPGIAPAAVFNITPEMLAKFAPVESPDLDWLFETLSTYEQYMVEVGAGQKVTDGSAMAVIISTLMLVSMLPLAATHTISIKTFQGLPYPDFTKIPQAAINPITKTGYTAAQTQAIQSLVSTSQGLSRAEIISRLFTIMSSLP